MSIDNQTPVDPEPFPISPPPYQPMDPAEVPEELPGQPFNPDPDYPGPGQPIPTDPPPALPNP